MAVAERLIQVQNFPQNKIEDLSLARETLRSADVEWLETLFGLPPFVLSQLITTAFIPSPGNRFIVSDFAAIEGRVYLLVSRRRVEIGCIQNARKSVRGNRGEQVRRSIRDDCERPHQPSVTAQRGKVA
ncbi:hypothetical protein [Brevibacillus reuszeri]|uniref:hypothetical protein n=1 Tax=Brevibacillus reuszeri TaxID=54915 RepID=UPI001F4574BE|nr:hypothetical protein [Brevibacillus reuszeri]